MAVVPFVGYVRDQEGNGVATATVEAYSLEDLNSNQKSVNPLESTSPDSQTGRWNLFVDTDLSPTGFISIKITSGNFIRWIEGDATMQAQRFFAENGSAPILDDAITDAMIGLRTVNQALTPSSNSGDLTSLLSGLANRIRTISGTTNWYNAPSASILTLWNKFNSSTGHDHSGDANEGPQIDTDGIASGAVTESKLSSGVQSKLNSDETGGAEWEVSQHSLTGSVFLDGSLQTILTASNITPGTWVFIGSVTVFGAGPATINAFLYQDGTQLREMRSSGGDQYANLTVVSRVQTLLSTSDVTLRVRCGTGQAGLRSLIGFRVG